MTKPAAGEVCRYPFLWKREQMAGATEGRKTRRVCITVTIAKSDSETVVYILPITTQSRYPRANLSRCHRSSRSAWG